MISQNILIRYIPMKAIIPAAGTGSRLKHWTNAIPKELINIAGKPPIERAIEKIRDAGLNNIIIVVGKKKGALMDYLGDGSRLNVNLTYVYQENPTGLAHSILTAEKLIEDDFLVYLGDNVIDSDSILNKLIEFHKTNSSSATLVVKKLDDVSAHGVIKPTNNNSVECIVEKPKKEEAPSNLAVMGLYMFNKVIFEQINLVKPDKNNEYQLTDAIQFLIHKNYKVNYLEFRGEVWNVGDIPSLIECEKYFISKY